MGACHCSREVEGSDKSIQDQDPPKDRGLDIKSSPEAKGAPSPGLAREKGIKEGPSASASASLRKESSTAPRASSTLKASPTEDDDNDEKFRGPLRRQSTLTTVETATSFEPEPVTVPDEPIAYIIFPEEDDHHMHYDELYTQYIEVPDEPLGHIVFNPEEAIRKEEDSEVALPAVESQRRSDQM
uniref:Uncharacterized protein n=1 Tax=Lotharella globosa TaxID=91324 RepID=A0A7S3YPX0_9EUKA|mmetsp:Transcript_1545/g.2948  ORF Transcript_1545/g.2948 Transcript_1545/m.2948 type:complete len:185 (+) Transcript_1545:143-697(+)|eukprot:CAMPEP_0167789764 /NCGR_PEP_ID=MMETSP0111_2-20121227/10884_1 /TAXON_ID=91324 /ORGANISM="Lotharella globosa, Strain CCCM811" /LENGTH=184 /DNA_ID=CAMNT_0007682003 /DNA_START=131 /DNA_END=685 /DNA_ORIENTATION=-